MGWAQMAGKTVDWRGHCPRESSFHLDLLRALPASLWFLPSLVGCGEKEVPGVGRQAVLLRAVCRGWQTWIKMPAPSLPNRMDLSKSPCYLKPQFPHL